MKTASNFDEPAYASPVAYWLHLAKNEFVYARYSQYRGIVSHLQSFVLLFLRLTIAWQLAESGYGHLMNVQGTAQHFREWGVLMPVISVYVSGSTELLGGVLLIFGLGARLIAVPLLFNFFVAYATACRDNLIQLFTGPKRLDGYDAVINDAAFTMIVLSLSMLAFGAGKVSIDYMFKRLGERCEAEEAIRHVDSASFERNNIVPFRSGTGEL